MTDEKAKRVALLIKNKEELQYHIRQFKESEVHFTINYKIKGVMYLNGETHNLFPKDYELSEKEISDFIISKIEQKLQEITKELEML